MLTHPGPAVEQLFVGQEAPQRILGRLDPVGSDDQAWVARALQPFPEAVNPLLDRARACEPLQPVGVDRDRVGPDRDPAITPAHGPAVGVHACLAHRAGDRVQEVRGVAIGLEPHEVALQQPLADRAPQGGRQHLPLAGRGPRDVVEVGDRGLGQGPPDRPRGQVQVVVLEQHDRPRPAADGVDGRRRQRLVRRPVATAPGGEQGRVDVGAVGGGEHAVLMEPQERVGNHVVERLEHGAVERDQVQLEVLVREHLPDQALDDRRVDLALARPAPRSPQPRAAALQRAAGCLVPLADRSRDPGDGRVPAQVAQGGDQAAGAARGGEPIGCGGIQVETDGTTIRDDEQAPGRAEQVVQHPRSVAWHGFMIPGALQRPRRISRPRRPPCPRCPA